MDVTELPRPAETVGLPAPRPAAAVRRWPGYVLLASGVALVPWLVVLAVTLPDTGVGGHWTLAWVGLDAMEAAGLITTGALALRRHRGVPVVASATAVLLLIDAWFDVTTSGGGGDLTVALVMALTAELPLAAACTAVALRTLPRPPAAVSSIAGPAE